MMSDAVNDELDKEHDEVRAAFRAAGFDEEPPAEVDAAIRAAAKAAPTRRLHGYLPPLAMAATVVLALGLVLRLAIPTREPTPAVADRPEAELGPSRLESESTPGETASGRADAARERATSQMRAPLGDTAEPAAPAPDTAREEVVVNARTAPASAAADPAAATEAMSALPADCAARFGENADAWLDCISALLEAGDEAAARRELAAFTASYPDHSVPEALATRLAP